ncbi:MAG: hypothetical protein M3021_07770, partial [Actinomycetota bacterium]|nr:hypothetical protein [Actinomycetota bacterium]
RVDEGPDFYAPQVLAASPDEPRTLMWGWSWDESRPAADVLASGWAGALTYARSVSFRDGVLQVEPVAEVATLRTSVLFTGADEFVVPIDERAFEVEASGTVELVSVDGGAETVVADIEGGRILVDGSLVEVFGTGAVTKTVHSYPTPTSHFVVRPRVSSVTVHKLAL